MLSLCRQNLLRHTPSFQLPQAPRVGSSVELMAARCFATKKTPDLRIAELEEKFRTQRGKIKLLQIPTEIKKILKEIKAIPREIVFVEQEYSIHLSKENTPKRLKKISKEKYDSLLEIFIKRRLLEGELLGLKIIQAVLLNKNYKFSNRSSFSENFMENLCILANGFTDNYDFLFGDYGTELEEQFPAHRNERLHYYNRRRTIVYSGIVKILCDVEFQNNPLHFIEVLKREESVNNYVVSQFFFEIIDKFKNNSYKDDEDELNRKIFDSFMQSLDRVI